jgi:integrase/recombinase XerC
MTTADRVSADLGAVVTAWRQRLHIDGAADRTVIAYRRDLTTFIDYLTRKADRPPGLDDLARLETADFQDYCVHLTTLGRTPASVARAVSALRHFFRFLAAQQGIHNPHILRLPAPRVAKPSRLPLTKEEAVKAVRLIADLSDAPWIAKRDEALFALLYASGLRLGEALALNRDQVPGGGGLTVGTGRSRRTVPVLPFVPALIAEYLAACPYRLNATQPLFVGARGKRLNPGVVQRQMRRLRLWLGLPADATPHTLRLCFAQRLRTEGNDLRAIQHLLGHAYPSTTQRYPDLR